MIIRDNDELARKTLLMNKLTCGVYSNIKSFDTETCEAEIYLLVIEREIGLIDKLREKFKPKYPIVASKLLEKNGIIKTAKTILEDAILINRETLEIIK